MQNDAHDREFWFPSQPSRGQAVVLIAGMMGVVLLSAAVIVAAVV